MTERPEPTIMRAVALLHSRGMQRVRMRANFYATGHWRCRVFVPNRGDGLSTERDPILWYTNGLEWDVFGDGRTSWTDARLADEFARRLARMPRCRQPDPAYAEWFRGLVARTGDGVFASYDEYDDWEGEGRIAVFTEHGRTADGMPLPPGA
jgi:hypothetical protein